MKEREEGTQQAAPLPPYPPPKKEDPPLPSAGDTAGSRLTMAASAVAPIAPTLGVDYPFPPQLEYAYPPPDGNILTNVVNTLIAVPRFYTQVLHLMNKMNLPAPFRPALPTPPLPPAAPFPAPPRDLSSGESELESSDEEDGNPEAMNEDSLGPDGELERHRPARKRAKREAIVGPAVDKDASHEAAGVKPIRILPKDAPLIRKNKPVLQIKINPKASMSEGASERSRQEPEMEMDTSREGSSHSGKIATRAELQTGKVPPTDILSLPMFKNYAPGNPTQVLYIKNLGKEVAPEDLFYVFGAFFTSHEEAKDALAVKLMQEGRMRGQAFVTFPSTQLAEDALATTHGFVLKGKPMIVQFGRNPSATKASHT